MYLKTEMMSTKALEKLIRNMGVELGESGRKWYGDCAISREDCQILTLSIPILLLLWLRFPRSCSPVRLLLAHIKVSIKINKNMRVFEVSPICKKPVWWGRPDLNRRPLPNLGAKPKFTGFSMTAPEIRHSPRGVSKPVKWFAFWSPSSYLSRLRPHPLGSNPITEQAPIKIFMQCPMHKRAKAVFIMAIGPRRTVYQ